MILFNYLSPIKEKAQPGGVFYYLLDDNKNVVEIQNNGSASLIEDEGSNDWEDLSISVEDVDHYLAKHMNVEDKMKLINNFR